MAKKQATTTGKGSVCIRALNIERVKVTLEGVTPLLVNALSDEAKGGITGSGAGKKGNARTKPVLTLEQKFANAIHVFDKKSHGFPAASIKKALISAVRILNETGNQVVTQLAFKSMVSVYPCDGHPWLMKLQYESVKRADAWAMLKGKTPIPVARPCYTGWSCNCVLEYDSDLIEREAVLNLLARAGAQVGIGAWRPESNGNNGMFNIGAVKVEKPRKVA